MKVASNAHALFQSVTNVQSLDYRYRFELVFLALYGLPADFPQNIRMIPEEDLYPVLFSTICRRGAAVAPWALARVQEYVDIKPVPLHSISGSSSSSASYRALSACDKMRAPLQDALQKSDAKTDLSFFLSQLHHVATMVQRVAVGMAEQVTRSDFARLQHWHQALTSLRTCGEQLLHAPKSDPTYILGLLRAELRDHCDVDEPPHKRWSTNPGPEAVLANMLSMARLGLLQQAAPAPSPTSPVPTSTTPRPPPVPLPPRHQRPNHQPAVTTGRQQQQHQPLMSAASVSSTRPPGPLPPHLTPWNNRDPAKKAYRRPAGESHAMTLQNLSTAAAATPTVLTSVMVCGDFNKSACPRGLTCPYLHAHGHCLANNASPSTCGHPGHSCNNADLRGRI